LRQSVCLFWRGGGGVRSAEGLWVLEYMSGRAEEEYGDGRRGLKGGVPVLRMRVSATMADASHNGVKFDINSLSNNVNFDLINILSQADDDVFTNNSNDAQNVNTPYNSNTVNCKYAANLSEFNVAESNLSILSLNVQSLNAKFSDLCEFVDSCRPFCTPDVICLQELWQFPNCANFTIQGYSPLIYKLRSNNVNGGGVGIFVKSDINFCVNPIFSIFHDRIFECIMIEILMNNGKKLLIGSLYRPGTKHPNLLMSEQNEIFFELLSNLLSGINDNNYQSLLFGDLNLDVLKYKQCNIVTEYIDTLFCHGFIQSITKTTRVTNHTYRSLPI